MCYAYVRRAVVTGLCLAASTTLPLAQNLNSSFVGRLDQSGSQYADVWAEGNVAFLARFGQSMVDIADISNPASPSLLATYSMSSPDDGSSAQDVKSGDGLLFIASESGGSNGVHIVDVRNPSSPQLLTLVDPEPGSFEFIHNVFYDNGWLYMVNSSDTTVAIVDLRSYDPDNAPAAIGSWTYQVNVPGALFIHDLTVSNGKMYCSGWDNLTVWDVSSLGSSAPSLLGTVQGMSNHAVWPTDDGEYIVTTDEREGGAMRLYQMIDNGSSVTILPRDSYQIDINESYSAHNPVIAGDRIYTSYYQAGGTVHQIDRSSHTLELVARYDTSSAVASGFAGCWGVYPFTGADRVLFSDISNGLYIIDMSAVQIAFVDPRPDMLEVGSTQAIVVELTNLGNVTANTGTVNLMASVNGAPYQAIPMTFLGGGQYSAELPRMNCNSTTEYYVAVDDLGGATWTNPVNAPGDVFEVHSAGATPTMLFSDTFQTDLGWTVENTAISTGAWARGNPSGTGGQPENGDPEETGARCYVTGLTGGSIGNDDLDGGPTRLVSPLLDFSGGDGMISYSRWFFNDDGDGDTLEVAVTDNNGGTWKVVETVDTQNAGGWVKRSFRLSDAMVNPTSQVRVRFTVADEPNSSITEAGIDAFRAVRFDCASAALAQVRTGTGINPNVFSSQSLPIVGMDWMSEIDASGVAGANLTYLLGFQLPFDPGLMLSFGELLIDITSEPLITNSLVPAGNGLAAHVIPIPNDVQFQGFQVYNQGVVFAPGSVTLTNAIDITIDY